MKILISETLFDKEIFYQSWYKGETHSGQVIEIDDRYSDCVREDFDGFEFNLEKYNARKKQENSISYEQLVVSKIREKYTIDQELAILRQRDTKPQEFAEYNEYVESCKAQAKEEV
jgi:hypothetical protein